MARTMESGLDYFPLDVDVFDNEKIELIESEFGIKGSYIYIRILCLIYNKKGYYYEWNNDKKLLLAKSSGIEGNLVGEILLGLIRRSLFDKRVFDSFGVLTSQQIQSNYLEASRRRKQVNLISEYLLINPDVKKYSSVIINSIENNKIPHNVNINPINANINSQNDDINSQSKVKKSKVIDNIKLHSFQIFEKPYFIKGFLE